MTVVRYRFAHGATIALEIDFLDDAAGAIASVTAHLRLAKSNGVVPVDAVIAATFTVTGRAAAGDYPAGLSLRAASTGLGTGVYRGDARLVMSDGSIEVTEPWEVEIYEPATRDVP